MFIKHTSRHYYKLGSNREFFDQENPLGPEATGIVLELQEKYDSLIEYLEHCYQTLRAGGKPEEAPAWLNAEVAKVKLTAIEVASRSLLLRPQPALLNTNVSVSSGSQNPESTLPTSD